MVLWAVLVRNPEVTVQKVISLTEVRFDTSRQ